MEVARGWELLLVGIEVRFYKMTGVRKDGGGVTQK